MTTLRRNRPARINGARVMAGNIRLDPLVSNRRAGQRPLRADIWVKDPRCPWKTFTVRPGQLFDIAGARIAIVSVASDAVVLEVRALPCSTLATCTR